MKYISTFIFLFLTLNVLSQKNKLSEEFEYKDFRVNFPKGWKAEDDNFMHELILYPPSVGDEYKTSINFFAMKSETEITDIEEYSKSSESLLNLRADVLSSKILDSKNGKCIRYDYTMNFYGSKLFGIQYRFIKGDTVYSISFSGEEKSYTTYKKVAEKVIMSFLFK